MIQFGSRVVCMREPSPLKTKRGNWLHILDGAAAPSFPSRPKPEPEITTHPPRPVPYLQAVYSELTSRLTLSAEHADALARRGLSRAAVDAFGYRSAPAPRDGDALARDLARRFDLRGVPGFYRERGAWRLRYFGPGLLIPYADAQGVARAYQVRRDGDVKPRYLWLSSSDRQDGATCPARAAVIRPDLIRQTGRVVITEGALKAHVSSERLGLGFIAFAGATIIPEGFAAALTKSFPEVRRVSLAYDRDFRSNRFVRGAIIKLLSRFTLAPFAVDVWVWESEAKGIDDLVSPAAAAT